MMASVNADNTGTLTPGDDGIWIATVGFFSVFVYAVTSTLARRRRSAYPRIAAASAWLFALSVSLFAYNVYWWFAAGSYADTANKLIPHSAWRSYPLGGVALIVTVIFGATTLALIFKRPKA